jgi:hypothetical protein
MSQVLTWIVVVYFIIGLSITAFCVHMSYHEAAVGFGDDHDTKAQKVLESRIGPLGFIFLFTFWPLALLIAFMGGSKPSEAHGAPAPAAENPQQNAATPAASAPAHSK